MLVVVMEQAANRAYMVTPATVTAAAIGPPTAITSTVRAPAV